MILNGELPAALLATVPWDTAERLRPGALADLLRLNAAFRAVFGHNLIINESYRTLARQQAYYDKPPSGVGTAAWPGTSNHGWGLAIDLHLTAAEYAWMRANAPRYGWVNPAWAHDGRGVEEPWHWEHATAQSVIPDTITPAPTQEDDMPLNAADATLINGVVIRVLRSTEAKGIIRDAVLTAVLDEGVGTLSQAVRDARVIARRTEIAVLALPTPGTPSVGTIDYAALAKAVNDDAAARMAS